jgi:uncharacterized membrane protein
LRNTRGFLESLSAEEPFWAARGKKSILQEDERPHDRSGLQEPMSAAESTWSGTRKRSAVDGIDDRHELIESMSADEPVWAANGKTSILHSAQNSRNKRSLLDSISEEEPYWAARGRRTAEESEEKRGIRGSFRESLSAEEPFWAARGRRDFLESLSAEEPFWAARGKKESPRMTSPSPEDFLSQVSSLHASLNCAQTMKMAIMITEIAKFVVHVKLRNTFHTVSVYYGLCFSTRCFIVRSNIELRETG